MYAWQLIAAECLGLKLSKFDLEQHLVRPVKAEIETTPLNQYKNVLLNRQENMSSTICVIQ